MRANRKAYLFSPAEAERKAGMRARRKTKVQLSQRGRSKPRPRRKPGECYTVDSYRRAIDRGYDLAHPHPTLARVKAADLTVGQWDELGAWKRAHRFHPNQLRHNAATWLRREYGLDTARVILDHSSLRTTEIYAELDQDKARDIMGRVG